MERGQCPIHNGTLKTFILFLGLKMFNSDNSFMFFSSRNAQVTWKSVKKLLTLISY